MSDFLAGMQVTGNKKTKLINLEFPYGDGIAAEITLTPEKAAKLAKVLIHTAIALGWEDNQQSI